MSIILNALQKKDQHVHGDLQNHKPWKMALFIALSLIIILLCTLIFVLLHPLMYTTAQRVEAEVSEVRPIVRNSEPEVSAKGRVTPVVPAKLITQISFDTKRLPIIPDETEVPRSTVSDKKNSMLAKKGNSTKALVELKPITVFKPDEVDIDYNNVSDELQHRFKQALLMSKDEVKTFIESDNEDGSDIHHMTGSFQEKVPAFSYDFHVYSSVAKARWIRINDEDLKEGQFDRTGKIQIIEIQPNRTIFRLGAQSFSVKSLIDWRGFNANLTK